MALTDSRTYWRKREEEALKHYVTDEKEYDKEINRIYSNMLDACNKEINAFYGRYADKEGITIAEAKKRVTELDIKEYERKAARYVKDREFSKQANEEMRLYNATMRINRLEMLKANIGLEMIKGHDELEKFMGGILKGRTEEELARQAGILGKTIKDNAKAAHAIVNGSFHNATFSDRIWLYQDLLRNDLNGLLQSGLIQGKNPRVLAREIKAKFNTSTYNAERLMRTELARVQTEAQKQSFERNGFDKYIFIVNAGCCGHCEEVADKDSGYGKGVYLVKDMQPGLNAPPLHPHDRCSTAAYSDSKEYNEWLEHLANGGTTAEFEALKAKKANNTAENKTADTGKTELETLREKFKTLDPSADFIEYYQTGKRIKELEKQQAQAEPQGNNALQKELEALKSKFAVLDPHNDFVEYLQTGKKIKELEKQIQAAKPQTSSKYSEITKTSEATAKLQEIGFKGVSNKFLNLNDDLIVDNVNALAKLEEKFGALKKSSVYIDTTPMSKGLAMVSTGAVDGSMQTLKFSSKHFGKTKADFVAYQKERSEAGWSSAASPKKYSVYTVTHEYGHIIENNVIGSRYKKLPFERRYELDNDGLKATTWHKGEAAKIQREILDIAAEKSGNKNIKSADYISDYGKTKCEEFFAEAFANSQLDEPNLIGEAMQIWLERNGIKNDT